MAAQGLLALPQGLLASPIRDHAHWYALGATSTIDPCTLEAIWLPRRYATLQRS